jgi:hypothetical protein
VSWVRSNNIKVNRTCIDICLARSSVYFNNEKPIETKQVSMDGFSLFYSHLMNGQSGLHLQQAAQADAQTIMSNFELNNKDLFQRNVEANMMVLVAGVNEPEGMDSTLVFILISSHFIISYFETRGFALCYGRCYRKVCRHGTKVSG